MPPFYFNFIQVPNIMKRLHQLSLIFLVLLGVSGNLNATHIVGGELEVQHETGESYTIRLIQYFDAFYGNPGAEDDEITVYAYGKADNSLKDIFILPKTDVSFVEYTNPEDCSIEQLQTKRIVYELQGVTLSSGVYNHPDGYYLMWDRCCRNNIIENIINPEAAGQLFYLEFPPVVKNGAPFVNSTPKLFPPLSDYACVGLPYYADFAGEDADGDSLVYSLSIPMRGFSSTNFPIPDAPSPASNPGTESPYPTVTFAGGYDVNNMVRGTPSLNISDEGFLTVTPNETGLFVFAVKCEEYRDGEKIGEVRRDFQMLVIDCIDRDPPVLNFENESPNVNSTTLTYQAGDADTCIVFNITDPNIGSKLNVEVTPISHSTTNGITYEILTPLEIGPNDSAQFQVCIPGCTEIVDELYQFEVRVYDNTCALPLWDTATITLDVKAPFNNPPEDSLRTEGFEHISYNTTTGCYDAELLVGDTLRFGIDAFDADSDSLWVYALSSSIDLIAEGFSADTILGDGFISTDFEWIPTCTNLPDGSLEREIEISLIVADVWKCGVKSRDTICVNITLGQPPFDNESPELSWEDTNSELEEIGDILCDTIFVDETISFKIIGEDPDTTELVRLSAVPVGFNLASVGMIFNDREKTLNPGGTTTSDTIASTFSWTPDCSTLNGGTEQTYLIDFIMEDENGCSFESYDTLRVKIIVQDLPQPDSGPFPNAFSPNDDAINDTYTITNLPIDNCSDIFIGIEIYDRWGKKIFESNERGFEWDGSKHPSGVYYYYVKYMNSGFKGTIHLLRGNTDN